MLYKINMKTLLICPVYNERFTIIDFLATIIKYVGKEVHLLIIDDFSDDGTKDLIFKAYKSLPFLLRNKVFVIFNDFNVGYGENVLKGFRFALENEYNKILTIDCDFQHLPFYIPAFISLSKKYSFITGTRYSFSSFNLSEKNYYRTLINKKMTELLNIFYKVNITDFFCGFRIYDKDLLTSIYKNLVTYKNEKKINFSYDFPIYVWIEVLDFTQNIKEFPIPYIFWFDRKFKGRNTISDHYQRYKVYVEKFIDYYHRRRGESFEECK